jgi:hypothetical protein
MYFFFILIGRYSLPPPKESLPLDLDISDFLDTFTYRGGTSDTYEIDTTGVCAYLKTQ